MTDRQILYVTTFLRALATGMIGVLLAIYLRQLDFKDPQIGLVIAAGLLAGTVAITMEVLLADRLGRKSSLLLLASLSGGGGFLAAAVSNPAVMIVASFIGLLNGMGRDRGPSFVLEQAILPETVSDEKRTFSFAWYNLIQDIGHALGGVLAGLPTLMRSATHSTVIGSFKLSISVYALLMLFCIPFYLKFSSHVEVGKERE